MAIKTQRGQREMKSIKELLQDEKDGYVDEIRDRWTNKDVLRIVKYYRSKIKKLKKEITELEDIKEDLSYECKELGNRM